MMDENNRNLLIALALSVLVLIGWQFLFPPSSLEHAREQQQAAQQTQQTNTPQATPTATPKPGANAPATPEAAPVSTETREAALAASPRVEIDTPSLRGSIALKGARVDDLVLKRFRVSVDPNSDNVVLLSPSGSPSPYYTEQGWTVTAKEGVKVPTENTLWKVETPGPLTPNHPVTFVYDNGEGLIFRRTISVDQDYMFTITQGVENKSARPVTLYPYSLISRHGLPETAGYRILHEGLIGVVGDEGLQEIKYKDALDAGTSTFKATSGWLGITDKYWATALVPNQTSPYEAHFQGRKVNNVDVFQTDFLLGPVTVAPGGKESVSSKVFGGAKQVNIIDAYENKDNIKKFELLIDWGWFHFITKPMFYALDFFYRHIGNFGIAILIVTVLLKLAFFPLANKSYELMSKMKKLQPEMTRIRERYKDDKMKQQQALMALYKKEKVNPMAGCLPIVIQIPVFFSLYKVLYITIETRHAPFFGWIQDLSAPDPTTIFNLFGLIPWTPPHILMLGIWPLLMGISMFIQMQLNPAQPDPVQQKIFTWMPVVFTFMLARFPAGLVIYWTWNNTLSIIQQWVIMRRQGVEVNLLENIGLSRKTAGSARKG